MSKYNLKHEINNKITANAVQSDDETKHCYSKLLNVPVYCYRGMFISTVTVT